MMATILDRLVESTLEILAQRQNSTPLAHLKDMAAAQRPARDFAVALSGPQIRLIAEVKRASPSKGVLNASIDAQSQARSYEQAGAAAISVLTEPRYFQGSLADLAAVSSAVNVPALRKDFILDPYQVYEARAFGADAILLIAAILSDRQLAALLDITRELGMAALVEVHDRIELERTLRLDAVNVVGVNNRNLNDFTVELQTTLALRPFVREGIVVVSESGIHTRDDVLRLAAARVNAILVGEALVTSPDPLTKIEELLA